MKTGTEETEYETGWHLEHGRTNGRYQEGEKHALNMSDGPGAQSAVDGNLVCGCETRSPGIPGKTRLAPVASGGVLTIHQSPIMSSDDSGRTLLAS